MGKRTEWTRVVCRTFKSGISKGEVIALFIDDYKPETKHIVGSYMHIGQHADADYQHIISMTRRATPEECGPLLDELHSIGYSNIEIMYRKHR